MKQKNGITYRKLPGLTTQGVRNWGLMFLIFGMVFNPKIEAAMSGKEAPFLVTTVALILQLLHYCAIPMFVFLLIEGITHTSSLKKYATRIGILAVAVQLPYNYAIYGELFSFKSYMIFRLNPVFGLLLAMVLIRYLRQYEGKSMKNILMKIVLWMVAFLWVKILRIEYGFPVILLAPIIYFLRNKRMLMIFAGCIALTLCGFLDSTGGQSYLKTAAYVASAPVSFMVLHFYNGERGEGNRYINYLAYPVMLIAIGLFAKFAI